MQAEKRLVGREQWFTWRAVWIVAIGTIFGDVSVFIDKRALILHVTTGTGRFNGWLKEQGAVRGAMRIVAISTIHLQFPDRMVRRLLKLAANFEMAFVTGLCHVFPCQLLLWTDMELMTVEATHLVNCMGATPPECKVG